MAVLIWMIGRYWGLEALGLYTIISIFYTIIASAGTIGLSEFCLDSINQRRNFLEEKKNLYYAIYFLFVIGICLAIFLFLLSETTHLIFDDFKILNSILAIKFLLLFLPFILVNRVFQVIFFAKGDFLVATVLPILRTSCLLGFGCYFIIYEDFEIGLIPLIFGLADLITFVVSISSAWKILTGSFNYPDFKKFFQDYVSKPKLALIYQSMTVFYIKIDVIVAWCFFPLSDLGRYAFIALFGEMLAQIGIVIRNVSFKFISDTFEILSRSEFTSFLNRLRLYSFGCCLIIASLMIGFVITLSDILPVPIWPHYLEILIICCLWGSFYCALISVDYSLMISGRFREQTNLCFGSLCVSSTFVGLGAYVWGLPAIPVALLIGTCLSLIVSIKKTNLKGVDNL
ncbi:MAG: hypothetical protein VX915_05750 [Pseudomonadota bacterium]|nr:hypothetical protein [Pseudomonadota bacterium]